LDWLNLAAAITAIVAKKMANRCQACVVTPAGPGKNQRNAPAATVMAPRNPEFRFMRAGAAGPPAGLEVLDFLIEPPLRLG
jgi:hypothetical protein